MDAASACSGLQTAFALSAQENKNNANVTSGVAARTSDKVILFQLASTKADGGGSSITLYAQAFDATTGTSLGAPGVIYATTQAGSGTVYLQDIAVAPSGELVLLYAFGEGQIYGELLGAPTMISELHAAFFSLAPPGDGGLTGLAFQRDVVLESGFFGGQAMAVWAAGEFILSWQYVAAEAPLSVAIKVSPYAATGGPNSGGVAEVPALPVGTSYVANTGPQQGAVGVSGSMLAVAFLSAGNEAPVVTFLAETGAVVDNPLQLPGTGPSATWVTVAGTSSGFAYIYSTSSSVGEAFIPAGSVAMDAAAPAVMTFPFTGAGQAYGGRAVGDGVHGTAGVALLYPDGVYFSLVSASGQAHSSPAAIINQTVTSPPTTGYPLFNVGTFGGSYVVGLYNPATQSTQAAWSGCQPPP
jgi:hypothetical protein